MLVQSIKFADIVLINSHHRIFYNLYLKWLYPNKLFVHRIDGKLSYHRGLIWWDNLILIQNKYISNATIYQSEWSKAIWKNELNTGLSKVIHNEADPDLFLAESHKVPSSRIVLLFASMSDNPNKGSDYLEWVTKNKDKYNLNIKIVGNVSTSGKEKNKFLISHEDMVDVYAKSDILLFPAKNESCSNTIIEAQASALPVLALRSGGNQDLVKDSGELFNNVGELIDGIKKISENYSTYSLAALKISKSRNSIQSYIDFFDSIKFIKNKSVLIIRIKLLYAFLLILGNKAIIKINH
jgi:glycosyltransferase involved in cell wall biosynthesis